MKQDTRRMYVETMLTREGNYETRLVFDKEKRPITALPLGDEEFQKAVEIITNQKNVLAEVGRNNTGIVTELTTD